MKKLMLLPIYNKELIKISKDKLIYTIKDEPNVLVKISNDKKLHQEKALMDKAHMFVPCPKVISYMEYGLLNYLLMEKIDGKTIYELYGDDPKNVPENIWKQVHEIITKLYYRDIHYVDISPYNFIVDKDEKVFIIDFGDAYESKVNWFLKDFLDGEKSWNSDFE